MPALDLHLLPKFRDGWSYLYVEHCRVDQEGKAIAIHDASGKVPVPCASLALLMLGPGVSITHAAITALADNGCLVAWCGEGAVRFYAVGLGETRSAANLLHQARLWADPARHLEVVVRMYRMRFPEAPSENLTLEQLRGLEGVRVREAYARASRETGVPWSGRQYKRTSWAEADPVNRALSVGNSCLYGVCHAGIVSAGFSPALGFVHTGKMLSFVYDVADLYKAEVTVPVAFREAAAGNADLERRVRKACRDAFTSQQLLHRIMEDLGRILAVDGAESAGPEYQADAARPGGLWDGAAGEVKGGENYSPGEDGDGRDGAGEGAAGPPG